MSVPARRRQVAYGRERGLSVRRACTLFSVARSALRYQGRKTVKDAGVIERMQELSAQYPRYGYRRIRIFLGRNGHRMSVGRAYRLWRAAGLQLPRKRPRKRVAAARPRPQAPSGPNQVWSYDFVFDHCANGQQLKCLTVTDEFTKEGLAIDVNARIRSPRVIDVLSRLVSARGAPSFLRSDNGPEFVSKALLSWIVAQGIGTALIEPGKPWQNGVAESFNGKFRDECLSLEWFRSRAEAKVIIETWRRHYNEVRPHSSLGYLTPNEFVARLPKAASRHATGQDAAVCGPSRPGPLHNPLRKEHMQKHGTPSQANRGPKNPGRSALVLGLIGVSAVKAETFGEWVLEQRGGSSMVTLSFKQSASVNNQLATSELAFICDQRHRSTSIGVMLIPFDGTFESHRDPVPILIQKTSDQYDRTDVIQNWRNGSEFLFLDGKDDVAELDIAL